MTMERFRPNKGYVVVWVNTDKLAELLPLNIEAVLSVFSGQFSISVSGSFLDEGPGETAWKYALFWFRTHSAFV